MKAKSENLEQLARGIEEADEKLTTLEKEIEEIGEPAAHTLRTRLEALKIEERALKRNFGRVEEGTAAHLKKVETLLHHIENEESLLEHEAEFLHQGSPSSVSVAFRAGAGLYESGARGVKKVIGDRRPWRSPFVNRTSADLVKRYHLPVTDGTEADD